MISSINNLLTPIEDFIKIYRKYIGYTILFLAFLSIIVLSEQKFTRLSGELSITILWIILWIPIFSRVFGLRICTQMLPLRRELGILMGILAIIHSLSYMIPNRGYITFWIDGRPTYLFFGFIAIILIIPLLLTSSTWAMKKMGKYWKTLHRLVYFVLIFSVIHITLIQSWKEFDIVPILFLLAYFFCKILEWREFSFLRK